MNSRQDVANALQRLGFVQLAHEKGMLLQCTTDTVTVVNGDRRIVISSRHYYYSGDMIISFDYYFDAVEPSFLGSGRCVDYSTPRYHAVTGFDLQPIFFWSMAEPILTARQYLDFAQLRSGDVVLDLGSYSGLTSILFREEVGVNGQVIAVDADEKNIVAMARNFNLYGRLTGRRISYIHAAVWNHSQGVLFNSEGNMGAAAVDAIGGERGDLRPVPSVTISAITEAAELNRVDFIKCDIEGAEAVAFDDSVFFEKFRPRIIIELHNNEIAPETSHCQKRLRSLGYSCEVIEQYGVPIPLLTALPL